MKPDGLSGERSAFQVAGITCPGERPWLGENANERNCIEPLIGALINQTNIYFPRTLSAIALPDLQPREEAVVTLRNEIEKDSEMLGVARSVWNMGRREAACAMLRPGLAARDVECDSVQLERALESLFASGGAGLPAGIATPASPESDLLAFRRAEFNIIRNEVDDPQHVPNLRVISADVPSDLSPWISRVNLVERLRETRVFYGFDRLDQSRATLGGMPDAAMRQLFRDPPVQAVDRWLPAIEIFGEGVYVELREDCLAAWQAENALWLEKRLDDGFIRRVSDVPQVLGPLSVADRSWAARYLLVHTFCHILVNQLVFECGYSTAALRERLYISSDAAAPMAGLLIYTAAGDSDGTLGGLVRLGRPEKLGPVVRRALGRASWCSADPVCSEHLGGQGSRHANLAACHACVLLPETSCETINQGLDRAMVVGTPVGPRQGFMSALLAEVYSMG